MQILSHNAVAPLLAFSVSAAICLLIRHVAVRFLDRRHTHHLAFGQVFLTAIRMPSILWCLAISIVFAIHSTTLSSGQLYWAHRGIGVFAISSMSLVAASIAVRMISIYGERNSIPFAVAGLSRTLTHGLVLSVGALMLLRLFGIEITPILTALGVGGLAVALALQDTLANLFAGIHILVESPIVLGDAIRLSTGEDGVVKDIGWRTTRLLTGGNNITVVPNTKITSGTLTNFSLPDKRVTAEISVLAAHEADPARVAALAIEIAAATQGILPEPPPTMLFDPGVTPTHLQWKLLVPVATQADRGVITSVIRMRLLQRFRTDGIPLPSTDKIILKG